MALFNSMGPWNLFIILFLYAVPIWAVIDIVRWPDVTWNHAGRSRLAWTAISIFFGVAGALVYATAIRPQLRRAASGITSSPANRETEAEPHGVGGEDRG